MTQIGWIRKLVARPSNPRTARRPVTARAARRPGLECLEDRTLLTTGLTASLLDPAFGTGGKVLVPAGKGSAELHAVAVQQDGKIVAAGVASDGTHEDFAVARFNANGTLDTSFNKTGVVLTPFGNTDSAASGIAVQADGKIVVVGDNGSDFAAARYNTDGSLDTTFNKTGTLTTSFAGAVAFANGVALQADGKIVVAGNAQVGAGGAAQNDFAVARYKTDGSLDTTFNHSGEALTSFPQGASAAAVAVGPGGKIAVVGTAGNNSNSSFAVAEYNADGSLYKAFGHGGGFTQNFGSLSGATAVQFQADGKLVVAGTGGGRFVVARYNANGSADRSFSGDGAAFASLGGYDAATGMALGPNGKIVVAGTVTTGDSQQLEFGLAGFDSHGNPDTTLGPNGTTTTAFAADATASDVTVQSNGQIVVAGSSGGDFALARYTPGPATPAQIGTTTSLTTSTANPVFGQKVTLTATVTPAPSAGTAPVLTGTVTFRDGDTVLGTVPLNGTSAQLTTTLKLGAHLNVTATYSGNSAFAGSTSSPLAEQVRQASTTTTVTASANPSVFGKPVTYTAHVAVAAPGAGTPGGWVIFLDGGSVMGYGRLNAKGTATLTTRRTLGPGTHHIVAVYAGSPAFTGSTSAALTQQVRASTDTRLSVPSRPVVFGQAVTLTARVSVDGPGGAKPTGTVTFKDGTHVLGTAQVSSNGVATLTLNGGLAVGQHTITALYGGNTNLALNASSDSEVLTVVPQMIVPPGKATAQK